jgi:hypothetical protein
MSTSRTSRSSHRSGKSRHGGSKKADAEEQSYIYLYIAVYEPSEGHYYHWAFAIYDSSAEASTEWCLFEAVRLNRTSFNTVARQIDPRTSSRCLPLHYVGAVYRSSLNDIIGIIQSIRAPANNANWDCQNYVTQICRELVDGGFVDADDYVGVTWPGVSPYHGYQELAFENRVQQRAGGGVVSEEYIEDSGSD